ncbi:MAG: hypothetical protein JXA10_10645 [Anaerolineae bacterium]|nr:hypothetical protein [Anaerolineae bacterium]
MDQQHPHDFIDDLADQLDELIPPAQTDLPAHDLADPALVVARRLAAAERPVMAADRVDQLEAQLRARVTMPQNHKHPRRKLVWAVRWVAAASVLIVFAITLAVGFALLDQDDAHMLTPDGNVVEAPDAAGSPAGIQPVSPVVIVRQTRESSVFVIPPGP